MLKNLTPIILFLSLMIISCDNDESIQTSIDNCSIEIPCGNPLGLISVQEATTMEEDYKNTFYGRINENMLAQYPDYQGAGRYIWFDLNEVKQYIAYIENHANENGYSGDLGLRVYMGVKYQENTNTGGMEPRQTIFFVPTIEQLDQNGVTVDRNIVSAKRLNLGGAGVPDSIDSNVGIGD